MITLVSGREEMTARGQDDGGFLLDLPLKKIDFILPLYVEKPFAPELNRTRSGIGTAAKGFSLILHVRIFCL